MTNRITMLLAAAITTCGTMFLTSCQPSEPEYIMLFDKVVDDKMFCPPDGHNCAYFKGRNIEKPNDNGQGVIQDQFSSAARQLLNTFYRDVAQANPRRFFEQENWQALFPPEILNATVMAEIANANYATLVVPGDSSIMFVHRPDAGMGAENLIFAIKRNAVRHPITDTLAP
jgi:hypothetical protein